MTEEWRTQIKKEGENACVWLRTWPGVFADMTSALKLATPVPDPAAVFACASSLWRACHKRAEEERLNLSEAYNGIDELMREVMRVANQFEAWACGHVDFNQLDDVWPYLLEDKFGDACMDAVFAAHVKSFDDEDCLRVALRLQFPVIFDGTLPIPVDVVALNPASESAFKKFRIQTVRNSLEENDCSPYTPADEPFDPEFGLPYFALYGITEDGLLEHIADRSSYADAVNLARKLAPGIQFPDPP
jgi:hypothetical protein